MTYLLKKSIFTGLLCLFTFISLNAQIVALQYRAVPQENIDEFLHRETTYWSEVAKKAIADGKLVGWELWQKVGGWNMDEGSSNFVFVNIFANKKQLDDMNGVWDYTKVFPNMRASEIETNSLAKTVHMVFLEGQGATGATHSNFAVVNYSKVADMPNFLTFETGTWQPFITKAMADGKTSVKGWSLATVLSPRGDFVGFNAMTVDRFDTFSEALSTTWDESLTFPDFTEYNKTGTREYIGIYALVKSVN